MMDVTSQINAVERRVGTRMLEAGEGRVVTVSQTYPADLEDVWDACTNPERIPRWFLPVSGDLHLGGRYQLEDNAGGTVERCDAPRSFAATWEFDGNMSWIEVRLTEVSDGRTRFEIDHVFHVDDHWAEFGPGAAGVGWDMGLVGLALHLTSETAVDPAELEAWFGSDEGRRFLTSSSDAWCAANVVDGADVDAARAAADRATAFYTAVPEQA